MLSPPQNFQHTPQTLAFHRQRFSVCLWRVLKTPGKSIFFPPYIPLSFPPLLHAFLRLKNYSKLTVLSSTIFLRSVYPVLPSLSQVVFLYARTSRPYKNTTAHRSIALFQVFTALCTCLFHRFSSLLSAVKVESFDIL